MSWTPDQPVHPDGAVPGAVLGAVLGAVAGEVEPTFNGRASPRILGIEIKLDELDRPIPGELPDH